MPSLPPFLQPVLSQWQIHETSRCIIVSNGVMQEKRQPNIVLTAVVIVVVPAIHLSLGGR